MPARSHAPTLTPTPLSSALPSVAGGRGAKARRHSSASWNPSTVAVAVAVAANSRFVASPEGRRTGCAAVSAEPWMANRERALLLSGRGIGLDLYALSLGYFSLCEQRKVTRAPQAIGSLACDSSLLFRQRGKRGKSLDSRLRGNDEQRQWQHQDGFQLSLE